MALPDVHIACGFAPADAPFGAKQPLFGVIDGAWSETPALDTITTNAATDRNGMMPVLRVTVQADAYLDIGTGDLTNAVTLLLMLDDGHTHDVYVKPGVKARVRAAV